jgi:5-formyltetrahydrofolate cyclo-ligase
VVSPTKAQLREAILAARSAITPQVHDAEADALRRHLPDVVDGPQTVCAYVPIRFEPGSIALLDTLSTLTDRVLLPVAHNDADGVPQPMRWGEYRKGQLVAARWGLREPAEPWLPAEAVAEATVVFVPALAVDRSGVRLGRGAGFYDRSLSLADPAARLVAVVRDDELVDEVPAEPHDVRMTHALTPGRGLVALA